MPHALRVYLWLVGAQMRAQLQYRASFALQICATFVSLFAEFVAILILFHTFQDLGGWRVGEIALLYGLVSIALGLVDMFASGFERVSTLVKAGEFDRLLTRPVSPFLQVLASDVQMRRLGRIAQGIVTIVLATRWVGIDWTPVSLGVAVAGVLSSSVVFLTVWVISAASCFWTVEQSEIQNVFTYGGAELASYPIHIYGRAVQSVFLYVVPLALTSYYPALVILGKPDPLGLPRVLGLLAPVTATTFFIVGLGCWRLGLRHYQGTGS
ncbi:MAG: ABC-2 family transporter protein [Thermomicrobiales bacterium]